MKIQLVNIFLSKDRTTKIYIVSIFPLAMAFLLSFKYGISDELSESFFLVGGIGFAIGFSFLMFEYLKKIWASNIGKYLIGIAHIVILFIDNTFSKHYAAAAVGLPPQDFDLTVAFLTFIFYIPSVIGFVLWLFVCIFLFLLLSFVYKAIRHAKLTANYTVVLGLEPILGGHIIGAAYLFFSFTWVGGIVHTIHPELFPMIRYVAYKSDYYEMSNYPGVRPNTRVKLHENGVVSYAIYDTQGVRIEVGRFDESK